MQAIKLTNLNLNLFTNQQQSLAGSVSLRDLPRLNQEQIESQQPSAVGQVKWHLLGQKISSSAHKSPQRYLTVSADTEIIVPCQRCLQALPIKLSIKRNYHIVAREPLATAEDELDEVDLLVASKQFDVLNLLEDELLLAMPLIYKHEQCESNLPFSVNTDNFEDKVPHQSPFATLAQLKKK